MYQGSRSSRSQINISISDNPSDLFFQASIRFQPLTTSDNYLYIVNSYHEPYRSRRLLLTSTMFDTTGKIAIAQLAFFIAAFIPSQYVLFKHRGTGFFGWLFICLFCIVRIVGAAIIIHDESGNNPVSETGLIISSVAIAPMIISISGIAHES